MNLYFRVPVLLAALTLTTTFALCGNRHATVTGASVAAPDNAAVNPNDVLYSFVVLGCNRIDEHDVDSPNTNKSTANMPELQRTFREVSVLTPKPAFLFFVGDLVLGLDNNPQKLKK